MSLFRLPLSRLRCEVHAQASGWLPGYLGSALRGAIASAYKRIVCVVRHRQCSVCHLRHQCTYPLIFEPPPRTDHPLLRAEGSPPALIIRPPRPRDWLHPTPQRIHAHQTISFELILFPPAVHQFPILLFSIQQALARGLGSQRVPFTLARIDQVTPTVVRPILRGTRWRPPRLQALWPRRWPIIHRGRIRFLTPLRLKQGRRYRFDAQFSTLFTALLRRLSRLGLLYGEGPVVDYLSLLEQARRIYTVEEHLTWVDWTRYSGRQQTVMQLGGWVGDLVVRGDLTPLWPWLRLGELVHVGKSTVFGLGRYRLTVLE